MKLITEVVAIKAFPLILEVALYVVETGDTLRVRQAGEESGMCIPPALAKDLLHYGCVEVPGMGEGDGE